MSKRSVDCNHKSFRMAEADVLACAGKVQGVYRMRKGSVYMNFFGCIAEKLLAYIGTKAVSGEAVCADTQKYKLLPAFSVVKDAVFKKIRDFSGGSGFICVNIKSHRFSSQCLS